MLPPVSPLSVTRTPNYRILQTLNWRIKFLLIPRTGHRLNVLGWKDGYATPIRPLPFSN